jgi:hypothetical protein
MIKTLTANRLGDGVAVWLTANGNWSELLADALCVRHAEGVSSIEAIGKSAFARNLVVDVNIIDLEEHGGGLRPVRLRERIRAEGPTVRRDLGKQADRHLAQAA